MIRNLRYDSRNKKYFCRVNGKFEKKILIKCKIKKWLKVEKNQGTKGWVLEMNNRNSPKRLEENY